MALEGEWRNCPICRKYDHTSWHRCKPEWECAMEDKKPDWHIVRGSHPDDAVKEFAEQYDCEGDYTIVQAGDRGEFVILVRKPGEPKTIKRFKVYGESVPRYYANELQNEAI